MAKIAHIIQIISSGGGKTVAQTYLPQYQKEFETSVYCCPGSEVPESLRAQGLHVYEVLPGRPRYTLFYIPVLAWRLRKEKPDLVIVHGQWGGLCGALAARLAGVRHVVYVTHMPSFYMDRDFRSLLRNRVAEQLTCALSSRVIALTLASRYQYLLRRLVSEEKIVHIPNGVNLDHISPATDKAALRQQLGLPATGPVVISLGRLDPDQKRLDWLIEAWRKVEEQLPQAYLGIIGDGSDREALMAQAQSLGLKGCHFLGSKSEGWRYFAAADLAVVTSMFEGGNPLSMLEALASGCPVVGTAADGVAESIQNHDCGLCVPVADTTALAEGILSLLLDPSRLQSMGAHARNYAKRTHNLNTSVEAQKALVHQLLAR